MKESQLGFLAGNIWLVGACVTQHEVTFLMTIVGVLHIVISIAFRLQEPSK